MATFSTVRVTNPGKIVTRKIRKSLTSAPRSAKLKTGRKTENGEKTMTTQKIEGKEIRFWDFDAPQYKTDEKGEPVEAPKLDAEGKPVLDAEGKPVLEKVQIGRGNWVRKPVDIEIDVPETTEEIAERFSSDDLVSIFAEGLKARAMREQGTAPSGTFSKAMVSAAVKGLKALPQFAALKRAQLNEAVMRFIGSNEATKKVFLDSYESLRGAEPEDNDDDEKA